MSAVEGERPWLPLGATYIPERKRWVVLFYRYDPASGYTYSRRIIDHSELPLMSEDRHGEVGR